MPLSKEYLRSLVPENLPSGYDLLEEGKKIGATLTAPEVKYLKKCGYTSAYQYRRDVAKKGIIRFTHNIGYPTVEETVKCIQEIHDFAEANGVVFENAQIIPDMTLAVPKELREASPESTGTVFNKLEDFEMLNMEDVNVDIVNQVLTVPNALQTTIDCVKAGLRSLGVSGELAWNFPGCDDHVSYVEDTVRSLGILASKKDEGFQTSCYVEDGLAGSCIDAVSFVGYYLFEQYIYRDLCGINFMSCFGGLVGDVRTKAALMIALNDLGSTDEYPGMVFTHSATTTQWDHDIECNYGPTLQELLMTMLTIRHYHLECQINVVPNSEHIRVPTLEEQKYAIVAAGRLLERIDQWEDLIDFTEVERRAEIIKREGQKMCQNILDDLKAAGIDTHDPLQLLMVIKNINAALFEEAFHPSVRETGKFTPYFPNDMGKITEEKIAEATKQIQTAGIADTALKGKKIVIGSLDTHAYGRRYVKSILESVGAEVIDGGVDCTVKSLFDLADEEGARYIGFSTHCGQCVGYSEQIMEIEKRRENKDFLFMGGILNTLLPGQSHPIDATDIVRKMGVFPSNNIVETIRAIARS